MRDLWKEGRQRQLQLFVLRPVLANGVGARWLLPTQSVSGYGVWDRLHLGFRSDALKLGGFADRSGRSARPRWLVAAIKGVNVSRDDRLGARGAAAGSGSGGDCDNAVLRIGGPGTSRDLPAVSILVPARLGIDGALSMHHLWLWTFLLSTSLLLLSYSLSTSLLLLPHSLPAPA